MKNDDVEHVTHIRPKTTPIYTKESETGGEYRIYRFANDFGAVAEAENDTGLWTATIVRFFGTSAFSFTSTTDTVAHHLTCDQLEQLLWVLKCKQRESVAYARPTKSLHSNIE